MESTNTGAESKQEGDKMLDIDEGGSMPSKAYLDAKEKEKKDFAEKVDKEMEQKAAEKKIDADKVY